jgi:hypothetical protein
MVSFLRTSLVHTKTWREYMLSFLFPLLYALCSEDRGYGVFSVYLSWTHFILETGYGVFSLYLSCTHNNQRTQDIVFSLYLS